MIAQIASLAGSFACLIFGHRFNHRGVCENCGVMLQGAFA